MSTALQALLRGLFSTLFAPAVRTATGTTNGTGIDMADYEGAAVVYLDSAAGTGTTPTFLPAIEESDDNATFTPVPVAEIVGGAFTVVTTVASQQQRTIDLSARKRYIRGSVFIGGTTPSFTSAMCIVAQKKYQN